MTLETYGRREIVTDVREVTAGNVVAILEKTLPQHLANAADMTRLLEYEAGRQYVTRKKTVRPEINAQCVDNVAAEVADFWLGFQWGNVATFVQRGEDEGGGLTEAVKSLNDCYEASGHRADSQRNGRFVEVTGIGNTFIDINMEWEEGDSYFTRDVLDPRSSYVVVSSYYPDRRPMLGVTFRDDERHNRYFTCFTKDARYEVVNHAITNGAATGGGTWRQASRSGERNPLGCIPIIEWFRSYDRMGVFEKQLSEMDNLNLLISDFTNDVDQNTQAVWWVNDVEFPQEEVTDSEGNVTVQEKKPKSGDWLHSYSTTDGRTPSVSPLVIPYDYTGMLNNILARRSLILQKCNVPQRNDNSGGSTGIAMDDATGWNAAEMAASKEQLILEGCMMRELRVVLAAIRESPYVSPSDPIMKLRPSDVQVNMRRQKSFEMSTKVNSIATLLSHGFSLEDVVATVPLFEDPSQVVQRSGAGVAKYQETVWKSQSTAEGGEGEDDPDGGRLMQDESDQTENSPRIDSTRTDR